MDLICPTCKNNCHTLHQHDFQTRQHSDGNLSSKRNGTSPKVQEFSCLHCGNPCHVVVSLFTNKGKEQSSTLTTEEPEEKVPIKESQTPAETDVNEEQEESNFIQDSTADNTKLTCANCDHDCHSLDSNKPASLKKDDEKMEVKHYFFVQNLICSSCDNFCHKIYTQPTVIKESEAGKSNEDPDYTDPLL
jgi:hypothetical protein